MPSVGGGEGRGAGERTGKNTGGEASREAEQFSADPSHRRAQCHNEYGQLGQRGTLSGKRCEESVACADSNTVDKKNEAKRAHPGGQGIAEVSGQ